MKRLLILLLALLVACGDDLPPAPMAPGVSNTGVGMALAGLPGWASDARDVVLTPSTAYFGDGVVVSVSNFDYIYSNAYFFNSKLNTWEQFSLQGEAAKEWIKGSAFGSISVSDARFKEGDNYVVVYACSKVGSSWDCNGNKWMLVDFKVMGSATGVIPEMANVNNYVINKAVPPFSVTGTLAEKDNFADINVIRYDAKYSEPKGLVVLVHVFDFNSRAELDKTVSTMFKDIINQGWKVHMGNNVAVFLDENDHRVAVWSSGKEIVYVETFDAASANKNIIDEYLRKYPSDLKKQ